MIRTYIIPLIAALGFGFGVFMVVRGQTPVPAAPPVSAPAAAPFKTFVAGAGIIEANTENISIGTPTAGVVVEVFVTVGQRVKASDPLFRLDDRPLQAEMVVRKAAQRSAEEQLARLKAMPRSEDIPPLEAKVAAAKAELGDMKKQLTRAESLGDSRAMSVEDVDRRRYAVDIAAAKLQQAEADLASLKAGAWKPDIEVAQTQLESARAQVQATQIELDRLVVRAPVAGEVLQVKVRAGEFAPAGVLAQPLIALGNTDPLHVRVDIDENDAWRVHAGVPAEGFARGNNKIKTPLKFVRFEPLVVPKKSLTGEATERVDTRVLQAIFSFSRGDLPLYVGQQMDVYIEAPPAGEAVGR